jgi:uncharacterized protein YjbJ (UPF0337 family)
MNKDIAEGKWKQIRGEIQRRWGKLTNSDLDQINGSHDKLVGKIQQMYGQQREAIERDIEEMEKAAKAMRQAGDLD